MRFPIHANLTIDPSGRPHLELEIENLAALPQLAKDFFYQMIRYGSYSDEAVADDCEGCSRNFHASKFHTNLTLSQDPDAGGEIQIRISPLGQPPSFSPSEPEAATPRPRKKK